MWAGFFPCNVCLGNIADKLFPQSGFDPNLMGQRKGSLGQKGWPLILIYLGKKRVEETES
jgi:hypothetical protein